MKPLIFRAQDLNDPLESAETFVMIESAEHCDGLACGATTIPFDVLGEYPKPHFHFVIRGEQPSASPRYSPLFDHQSFLAWEGIL